jgi:hypothetical protein
MYRIKATKIVDSVTVTKWIHPLFELTDLEVLAKPYPNKLVAEIGIKHVNKRYPELVKGYTLEASEWP